MRQVSCPARLLVPISLYKKNTQLAHVLWNYKGERPDLSRQRHRLQLAATLARFIYAHRMCITTAAGKEWDRVTIVPSSQNRPGAHPLEDVVGMIPGLRESYIRALEKGSQNITHLKADDHGYEPTTSVHGMRFLLIDDTYTSGARVHSAASALHLAGAEVVAVVVVGRIVDPDYNEESRTLWDGSNEVPFSFEVCCLEQPEDHENLS